jgi:hypothetical protein
MTPNAHAAAASQALFTARPSRWLIPLQLIPLQNKYNDRARAGLARGFNDLQFGQQLQVGVVKVVGFNAPWAYQLRGRAHAGQAEGEIAPNRA